MTNKTTFMVGYEIHSTFIRIVKKPMLPWPQGLTRPGLKLYHEIHPLFYIGLS